MIRYGKSLINLVVFLIFYVLWTFSASAVDDLCSQNNFNAIEKDCVSKSEEKLSEQIIDLEKIKQGHVLFYKTDTGSLGKMFVHSVEREGNECTLYYDFVTFGRYKNFSRSASSGIKNYLGVWDSQTINLDGAFNQPEFTLKYQENEGQQKGKEDGKCLLESEYGKVAVAGIIDLEGTRSRWLLYMFSILFIGLAVFLLTRLIFEDEEEFKSIEALEDVNDEPRKEKESIILKYSRPFFKRYFSPVVNGMKNKKNIQEKYKKPLAAAGMTKKMSEVDFFAFKLFLIIGFPVMYLLMREFMEADWPLIFTPLMGVLGFIYPDIWLKSRSDQRKEEIVVNLPFAVDMLALSVEAGLDFMAAMTRVLQKAPASALVEEFEIVIKEVQLGSTRSQALKKLAWRVDSLPMTSFCATLIAADSVGASIGPILKSISNEMRVKRSAVIEKKGAAAASKMLLPMIFFILPAVIIVIMSPMIMQFLGN